MPRLIIPFPTELRPRLPTIVGNVDYLTLRQSLEQIDPLLRTSGVEQEFVERALARWLAEGARTPSAREQQQFQLRSRKALRCTVLRTLLQEDYRGFSCQLAGHPLYQWFCLVDAVQERVATLGALAARGPDAGGDRHAAGERIDAVPEAGVKAALGTGRLLFGHDPAVAGPTSIFQWIGCCCATGCAP